MSPLCEVCGTSGTTSNLVLDHGTLATTRWLCMQCNMAAAQYTARRRRRQAGARALAAVVGRLLGWAYVLGVISGYSTTWRDGVARHTHVSWRGRRPYVLVVSRDVWRCWLTGRRYVGVDLSAEYHGIALRTRLAQGALIEGDA